MCPILSGSKYYLDYIVFVNIQESTIMLINIKENGKWGYYNSETGNVIPCRFCDSSDYVDGFAIVRTDYNSSYALLMKVEK